MRRRTGSRTTPERAPEPTGFAYVVSKNGDVVITHDVRTATTPRGATAARLLDDVTAGDPQEPMARLTGNDEHGNERDRRSRPRQR